MSAVRANKRHDILPESRNSDLFSFELILFERLHNMTADES